MSLYTYLLSSVKSTINSVGINEPIPSLKLIDSIGLKLRNCMFTWPIWLTSEIRSRDSKRQPCRRKSSVAYTCVTACDAMRWLRMTAATRVRASWKLTDLYAITRDDISVISCRCRAPAAPTMHLLQQLVVVVCMWSLSNDRTPAIAHAHAAP
jgi:hypothetical protein